MRLPKRILRSLAIVAAMVVVATFAVAAPAQAYWEDCYANPYVPFRNTSTNKVLFSGKVFCNSSNPGWIQIRVDHYYNTYPEGSHYKKCVSTDPPPPSLSCYSGTGAEPYKPGYWCTVMDVLVGVAWNARRFHEKACKDL